MKRPLPINKSVFSLLLALFLGMGTAFAYDFSAVCPTGQTLYYNVIDASNHYVELTFPGTTNHWWEGYTKPSGDITFPSTVNHNGITYTVTKIGVDAFSGCSDMTGQLNIPYSVTTIAGRAFFGCNGFTGTLTIPNSVTGIYAMAFHGCHGFSGDLNIPNSVTTIKGDAFSLCDGFTGMLNIGSNVTEIGKEAFEGCSNFSYVNYFATNCADVDTVAKPFKGCGGTLVISDNVERIPANMFLGSSFTGNLTIGTSVTSIGQSAFKNCGFAHVYFNATNCANANLPNTPFVGCTGTLTLGNNVQRIPAYMFNHASFTGSLTIPSSVTKICADAFCMCTGFTGPLYIPNSVTAIQLGAFYGCSGFTGSLVIPNSVTEIGRTAFRYCSGFNSTLTLGNSLKSIGSGAFSECPGFTGSLNIPNSVTKIGDDAFSGCSGFTGSLSIGNSVTEIGAHAFYYLIHLTGSLTIGNSVSSIGPGAFTGCKNITSMAVLPETPPSCGNSAFFLVPRDIPVTVSCSSIDAYQAAAYWSEFTNYICNYRVAVGAFPAEGGVVTGSGFYPSGSSCTVTASPLQGYLFLHWEKDGTVVSCDPSYTFTVDENANLLAVFMETAYAGTIIGESSGSNLFLPSYSYYNYSFTEQLYTASELGGSRIINSISFFNTGATATRNYDIFLKHTVKTDFANGTNWVLLESSDKVFSGNVTMQQGKWTTIVLDTPFNYNGNYNLVLAVDDNTGSYTEDYHMSCRTYDAVGNQALSIFSDGNDYNPYATLSSYTGTLMSKKNQIMLNRQGGFNITATSSSTTAGTVNGGGPFDAGDYCTLQATPQTGYLFMDWTDDSGVVISTDPHYTFVVTKSQSLTANFLPEGDYCGLTFNLHDSYGDGGNGNYLQVDFGNGMVQRLAVLAWDEASYTLPVENGSYVELNWIKSSWSEECSFEVNDSNGNEVCSSQWFDFDESYTFVMDCEGMPATTMVYVGNHSGTTNSYLPSYSSSNYSISEQIYTADEIGSDGLIYSIAFYNGGETRNRNCDIYLKHTEKTEFENSGDWIEVTNDYKVFSGFVAMESGKWTYIVFDTPFDYDGTSNLVLVVDDNTKTSKSGMKCRTFAANGNQAIYSKSDNVNLTSTNVSSVASHLLEEKNEILLGFITEAPVPTNLMVDNITVDSANVHWEGLHDSYRVRYRTVPDGTWVDKVVHQDSFSEGFEDGFGDWTLIDADGDGYNWTLRSQYHVASAYEGEEMVSSSSWKNNTVLYPDNYLVSPRINLKNTVTFWACAADSEYPYEHIGIAVSTNGNTDPADFTTVRYWTLDAKGEHHGGPRGNRGQGSWYQYTVDLSAYAGATGYIAIRHYDCHDQYAVCVDAFRNYDNAALPDGITLDGLEPNTTYEVQVQGIGHYGPTEWSEPVTFTTESANVTQTVNLIAGTNWFSTYLEITLADLQDALKTALGNNASITIKSQTQSCTLKRGQWQGQLTSMDVAQMYKIVVATPCEFTLEGEPINPADHPITLEEGTTVYIGYPLSQGMAVANVFTSSFIVNADQLKSQTLSTTVKRGSWNGQLTELEPGQGYIYKPAAGSGTRTFTFPASSK